MPFHHRSTYIGTYFCFYFCKTVASLTVAHGCDGVVFCEELDDSGCGEETLQPRVHVARVGEVAEAADT